MNTPTDVTSVIALNDYLLNVTFEDGKNGIFDMKPYLNKGVFKKLNDVSLFNRAYVDYGTVVWPGELDIAPERIYEAI